LTAVERGHSFLATITVATADGIHVPVLTMGVGRDRVIGQTYWQRLHKPALLPLMTDRANAPDEPWLAVRLEPGILLLGLVGLALPCVEVALAHGFIKLLSDRQGDRAAA